MKFIVVIVLLILALLAFAAAASGRFGPREVHLIAAGLAASILAVLIEIWH